MVPLPLCYGAIYCLSLLAGTLSLSPPPTMCESDGVPSSSVDAGEGRHASLRVMSGPPGWALGRSSYQCWTNQWSHGHSTFWFGFGFLRSDHARQIWLLVICLFLRVVRACCPNPASSAGTRGGPHSRFHACHFASCTRVDSILREGEDAVITLYPPRAASRFLVYAVGRACDSGHVSRRDCAGAILYSTEKAVEVTPEAMQCLGGNGYINGL